jgi:hypothetical protein
MLSAAPLAVTSVTTFADEDAISVSAVDADVMPASAAAAPVLRPPALPDAAVVVIQLPALSSGAARAATTRSVAPPGCSLGAEEPGKRPGYS